MGTKKKQYLAYLYLSPWILGLLIFQLYPILSSFYYSLTNLRILNKGSFVGLENFIYMFTKDSLFLKSLWVTIVYSIIAVPAKVAFALIIALILTIKIRFISVYRTIYYIPSILGGSVVIAVLWRFLFMHSGLINTLLGKAGIPPLKWLGPNLALVTISLLPAWQFGSSMVLFLAGLKNIPAELYEACRIDGANRLQMFRRVTIPLLTPIIFFNLIMQMINALQEFTSPFVITEGGPLHATYLLGMKIWEEGFSFYKMGYASAVSWVLMVIILALTITIFRTSSYWVFYEDEGKL